mmetsp:Transcript_101051/g.184395  ORF Transcript_101051/g.184395 Transcript_101051/m.184395 type:complete len:221 (-) Transcript_101051:280-942(-)
MKAVVHWSPPAHHDQPPGCPPREQRGNHCGYHLHCSCRVQQAATMMSSARGASVGKLHCAGQGTVSLCLRCAAEQVPLLQRCCWRWPVCSGSPVTASSPLELPPARMRCSVKTRRSLHYPPELPVLLRPPERQRRQWPLVATGLPDHHQVYPGLNQALWVQMSPTCHAQASLKAAVPRTVAMLGYDNWHVLLLPLKTGDLTRIGPLQARPGRHLSLPAPP